MANKGGFSVKRATGVTRAKQNVARKTGVPTSKSGRQRKYGAAAGGGCLTFIIQIIGAAAIISVILSLIM